jgi:hypothetical protein
MHDPDFDRGATRFFAPAPTAAGPEYAIVSGPPAIRADFFGAEYFGNAYEHEGAWRGGGAVGAWGGRGRGRGSFRGSS